jgi:hypothetical protein
VQCYEHSCCGGSQEQVSNDARKPLGTIGLIFPRLDSDCALGVFNQEDRSMKLKIVTGAVVMLFAVAGAVAAAKQDQSTSENGQEFSQSKKGTKSDQKPPGTAGSSFRRLGF